MTRRALGVAALLLLWGHVDAAASGDPYPAGASGYDVSHFQCGSAAPSGAFGVIAVNAGRPFYYNACLGEQFAAAGGAGANPSVYVNTGYSLDYANRIDDGCATAAAARAGSAGQQQAWAIGCSEAVSAVAYASVQSAALAGTWWLDVEDGNSWSTTDLTLNRYTLEGLVETLSGQGSTQVGVYSTPAQWARIAGPGWSLPGANADWVAAEAPASIGAACRVGFSGAPVWLVQVSVGSADLDYAC